MFIYIYIYIYIYLRKCIHRRLHVCLLTYILSDLLTHALESKIRNRLPLSTPSPPRPPTSKARYRAFSWRSSSSGPFGFWVSGFPGARLDVSNACERETEREREREREKERERVAILAQVLHLGLGACSALLRRGGGRG